MTSQEMSELVKKEPSLVPLEWVFRIMHHIIESDPDQIFIVDLVPSLRWLMRNEHLCKDCSEELSNFESKVGRSITQSTGHSITYLLAFT